MPKLILFAAMSLDGYLAKNNHLMDWLVGDDSDDATHDARYESFYKTVNTLVMGRITYEQIVHHLSPDVWPYPNKRSYIFSSQAYTSNNENIIFTQQNALSFIQNLKNDSTFGNIWLVGGAKLIKSCIESNMVDEYIISIIPTLLGEGIPLFLAQSISEQKLTLKSHSVINGIIELTYSKR